MRCLQAQGDYTFALGLGVRTGAMIRQTAGLVFLQGIDVGWNTFGSAVILACYVATLQVWEGGGETAFYTCMGAVIVSLVHIVWILLLSVLTTTTPNATAGVLGWITKVTKDWTSIIGGVIRLWHATSLLILDFTLIMLLSQPMAGNRKSPNHIPSELSYAPVIGCVCLVFSAGVRRWYSCAQTARNASEEGDDDERIVQCDAGEILLGYSRVADTLCCILSLPAFFVVVSWNSISSGAAEGGICAPMGDTATTLTLFCFLCLLYSLPVRGVPLDEPTIRAWWIVAGTGFIKMVVLLTGILIFRARVVGAQGGTCSPDNAVVVDYLHLRTLTQQPPLGMGNGDENTVATIFPVDNSHAVPLLEGSTGGHAGRLVTALFLKVCTVKSKLNWLFTGFGTLTDP